MQKDRLTVGNMQEHKHNPVLYPCLTLKEVVHASVIPKENIIIDYMTSNTDIKKFVEIQVVGTTQLPDQEQPFNIMFV